MRLCSAYIDSSVMGGMRAFLCFGPSWKIISKSICLLSHERTQYHEECENLGLHCEIEALPSFPFVRQSLVVVLRHNRECIRRSQQ